MKNQAHIFFAGFSFQVFILIGLGTALALPAEVEAQRLKLSPRQQAPVCNYIPGTALDDYILGTAFCDHIEGFEGFDWIEGGQGDDYLDGGAGVNVIDGGDGDDTLISGGVLDGGPNPYPSVEGGPGRDKLIITGVEDAIYGRALYDLWTMEVEEITVLQDYDTWVTDFSLNQDSSRIHLGGGDDWVTCGAPAGCEVVAGKGVNQIWTGTGDDTVTSANALTPDDITWQPAVFLNDGRDCLTITGDEDWNLIQSIGQSSVSYNLGTLGVEELTVLGDYPVNVNTYSLGFGESVTIRLGDGDDDIDAFTNGGNLLDAGGGTNTIVSGDGDDTVYTGGILLEPWGAHWVLLGGGYDRLILTGLEDQTLIEGAGYPFATYDLGPMGVEEFIVEQDVDTLIVSSEPAQDLYIRLAGGTDNIALSSHTGNVTVDISDGINVVDVGSGNDQIYIPRANLTPTDTGSLVRAGDGNDTVVITSDADGLMAASIGVWNKANYDLFEMEVETLVIASDQSVNVTAQQSFGQSYNVIAGGGNDTINFSLFADGDDTIEGGAGDDLLIGGMGDDTYIFHLGHGHDTIDTFPSGSDKIRLSSEIFQTPADAIAAAQPWINNGSIIDTSSGAGTSSIRIWFVPPQDLTADMFEIF